MRLALLPPQELLTLIFQMHATSTQSTPSEVSPATATLLYFYTVHDTFAVFLTFVKLFIVTTLKEMLISLKSSIHADIDSSIQKFKIEVQSIS